jgi:hypothetical protein
VVDFRHVSPQVFDASQHSVERAPGRERERRGSALVPRVECLACLVGARGMRQRDGGRATAGAS